jgi:hypothetical protein
MYNTTIVHLTMDKKRAINQETARIVKGSVERNSETTYFQFETFWKGYPKLYIKPVF